MFAEVITLSAQPEQQSGSVLEGIIAWFGQPEQWSGSGGIPNRLLEHLVYTFASFAIAIAIALPLGMLFGHVRGGWAGRLLGFLTISSANAARALPTFGLLILAVIVTAGGLVPTLIPLIALAVPPILVNVYTGVQQVEPELRDAAEGMGMTSAQVLLRVETPVALPLVLLGLRTAAIQIVSTATIAAYVGLGGLGRYIIDGLKQQDYNSTAGGAILVIALAILIQLAFGLLHRLAVSPGVRRPAMAS
jgi:osmoprotectant transport system permease protein